MAEILRDVALGAPAVGVTQLIIAVAAVDVGAWGGRIATDQQVICLAALWCQAVDLFVVRLRDKTMRTVEPQIAAHRWLTTKPEIGDIVTLSLRTQ